MNHINPFIIAENLRNNGIAPRWSLMLFIVMCRWKTLGYAEQFETADYIVQIFSIPLKASGFETFERVHRPYSNLGCSRDEISRNLEERWSKANWIEKNIYHRIGII